MKDLLEEWQVDILLLSSREADGRRETLVVALDSPMRERKVYHKWAVGDY